MKIAKEERGLIWLCACTDFDYRKRTALLRAAEDPAALLSRAFAELPPPEKREEQVCAFLEENERKGRFSVTCLSSLYPEVLRAIPEPPLVLFGEGNADLLKKRKFCVVGSRVTPPWAEKCAKEISSRLAERFCIVTGLAEGGDSAAIAGAIPAGQLIAVLPCGLDECYPASHASLKAQVARSGLLLSECAPHEKGRKYSFYARNRILAGLSEGVLVVSAGEKSGALITAGYALDYGRDVFAFPYNLGAAQGEGCNALIQKGAYLARSTEDILSCYGMEVPAKPAADLSEEEEKLLSVLRREGELHAAVLAEKAGMKIFEAASALSSLEMKGLAVKAGGNRYTAL